jgi:hypothetical protein
VIVVVVVTGGVVVVVVVVLIGLAVVVVVWFVDVCAKDVNAPKPNTAVKANTLNDFIFLNLNCD